MENERDYAKEIDSLQRTIRRLQALMASAALGLGAFALVGWTRGPGVVRASGLEIVDSKGRLRASIDVSKTDTKFKLAGGGPPNGKGVIPTAEWWLGVNVNALTLEDETGFVNIQPYRISLSDSGPRVTLERPLPFFAPPPQSGARIQVRNDGKVSTFPTK